MMLPACLMGAQGIVPAPLGCSAGQGIFTLSRSVRIEADGDGAKTVAEQFARRLKALKPLPKGNCGRVVFRLAEGLEMPHEGYSLTVTLDSIVACAASVDGLLRAEASLLQLAGHNAGVIAACSVTDSPAYAWRGLMLDESRHFFGEEKVKQYLDVMFRLKLNVFHWHLTDEPGWRIEIKRYPLLTKVGATGN